MPYDFESFKARDVVFYTKDKEGNYIPIGLPIPLANVTLKRSKRDILRYRRKFKKEYKKGRMAVCKAMWSFKAYLYNHSERVANYYLTGESLYGR